jgi:ArsR family transcriptional regulator, nickel/cobalt-responsive transcriptional repressor
MGHQRAGDSVRARLDAATARTVAATLQALAAPSRLLILESLSDGPMTVGELTGAVDMEQSAVSHQLRLLRDLGFVTSERQGRHMIYRLYDSHVAELMQQAIFHAEHVNAGVADKPSRPSFSEVVTRST